VEVGAEGNVTENGDKQSSGEPSAGEPDDWASFREEAREVLAACARGAQSAAPGGMLYAHHVGRLRFLARERAAALGLKPGAIEEVVAPFEARIDALCGSPGASQGGSPGPGISPPGA